MFPTDKERILATLREHEHEPELKAAGLVHLRLFGSVARGDNTPASDVDLMFDFDESQGNILHAYGFQDRVTEILGVEAHLSSSKHMKPKIRERVDPELVHVF